jgi:hypothetical protein
MQIHAVADFIVAPAAHLLFENVWTLCGVAFDFAKNRPIFAGNASNLSG